MTRYKVGVIIWGILFGIILICFLTNLSNPNATIPLGIFGGLMLIGLVINLIQLLRTRSPEYRERIAQQKAETPICLVVGNLVSGLDLPERTKLSIGLLSDKVKMSTNYGKGSANQTFNLSIDKITNAFVLSEQQVQQIVSQSAPGMIIGAAAFGILGAMVGGRTKTKHQTVSTYYFGIDYISSSNEKGQVIISTGGYSSAANTFVQKLNQIKPLENTTTQL